ncbi:hypothetical protein HQ393_01235 [Chitinibacter bivalviorum]|uniref:Uncharacterized protein n=1 Tax=Chitinibacter bivalviorum TaxID=2739434 RepID=A0A7H9BHG0_9NEIS|nr:hypothetical protein [Chitinibacter bivalviorum]QLG86974.1 hypothetical protein HQ393_01235 [Chitinibacter bivalviorum]
MVNIPQGGSAVQNPDLSWSQVQETILMLGIVVAQIRHAMDDSSSSLTTLADSFAGTAHHIEALKEALLEVGHQLPSDLNIEARVAEINEQNLRAVVAFQFYDRLSQRLDHVCGTVSALAGLVSDRQDRYVPEKWLSLQERIRSQYTMEQEKMLFDAIIKGMTINDAIALAGSVTLAESTALEGDIELF